MLSLMKRKQDFLGELDRHWFTLLPVFFGLGITFYFMLDKEPNPYMAPIVTAVMLLGSFTSYKSLKTLKSLVFLYLAVISLGFSFSQLRTYIISAPVLAKEIGPVFVIGHVEKIEDMVSGQRLVINVTSIEKLSPQMTPEKVRVRSYHAYGVKAGDKIKVLANLMPPSPPVMPSGFDFQRYAYFRQWGAVGYTLKKVEVLEKGSTSSAIKAAQSYIEEHIETSLETDKAAIPKALLVGNRAGIEEDKLQAIRDAGLAHMLAISGLHVGLVAGFIFFFVRAFLALIPPLALRYNVKKIAAVSGLIAAFLYMLLVGAPVTTQRAFIMTGLVMIAIIFDRYPFSFRLAALAALSILIYRPESLMEVSFQLSFSAVLGLIAFYDAFGRRLWQKFSSPSFFKKFLFWVLGVVLTTLVASVATAPLTLFHFQHFAIYGILGNILAVPVMTFWVMPMGVLSVIVMPLGLEFWPLKAMDVGVQIILHISFWITQVDGAVYHAKTWSFLSLMISLIGGFLLLFFPRTTWPIASLFFLTGFVLALQTRLPDILVSDDASALAYYDGHKLYVSAGRKGSFVKENWERAYGQEGERRYYLDQSFACDDDACRKQIKTYKLSYITSKQALSEECLWADILITSFPVEDKKCSAGTIIDRFDVWRDGVHAIYLDKKLYIETVKRERGERPWISSASR